MNNIICSGYFAPIHGGHISYLKHAANLGDRLFVIVNNDYQTGLKNSIPFMHESERLLIIKSLKYVNNAIISLDKDSSVVESIKYIYNLYNNIDSTNKWIFANGGDRTMWTANSDESELCRQLNIKYIMAVGGTSKYNSSSKLISNAAQKWVNIYYNRLNKQTIRKLIKNKLYDECSLNTRNELNRILHGYK